MFRFEHEYLLWLLLIIPFLIVVFWGMRLRRTKLMRKYADELLLPKLFGDVSDFKPKLKFGILLAGLLFLITALANPQFGTKQIEEKREGVDLIFALDVSNSMKSEDIAPSRLERAKQYISHLVDKLDGDRAGLIVFAGDAYMQLPLTSDISALKLFLSNVSTDLVPTQGTAIGAAIETALKSFKGTGDDESRKALIMISDGEDHEDNGPKLAAEASKKGYIIHTVGIGTLGGGPIPVFSQDGIRTGFMKDNSGNIVVTKLEPAYLEKIAAASGGRFILAAGDADEELSQLLNEIAGMETTEFDTKKSWDYESRFQYPLIISMFLFISEFLISEKKVKFLASLDIFGEKKK